RVRHLQRQANLLNPSLSESPAARDWASLSSARKSVKNPPGQSDPPPSPPQPPSNAASYTDSLPPAPRPCPANDIPCPRTPGVPITNENRLVVPDILGTPVKITTRSPAGDGRVRPAV